jgi:hypothetical protein
MSAQLSLASSRRRLSPASPPDPRKSVTRCCPVVELRQYTLKPGRRDVLIELFDREFVESQELVGMHVIGQFRDLDRLDRFVWLRGFADMTVRKTALESFYGGAVWKSHRDAANATMIDVDDVLLLRPLAPSTRFVPQPQRPAQGSESPASLLIATICSFDGPADRNLVGGTLVPALVATGTPPLAVFVEEPSENTFPALPVRTGEHVVVWFQRVAPIDVASTAGQMGEWRDVASEHLPGLIGPPLQVRLQPTPRSQLR